MEINAWTVLLAAAITAVATGLAACRQERKNRENCPPVDLQVKGDRLEGDALISCEKVLED